MHCLCLPGDHRLVRPRARRRATRTCPRRPRRRRASRSCPAAAWSPCYAAASRSLAWELKPPAAVTSQANKPETKCQYLINNFIDDKWGWWQVIENIYTFSIRSATLVCRPLHSLAASCARPRHWRAMPRRRQKCTLFTFSFIEKRGKM